MKRTILYVSVLSLSLAGCGGWRSEAVKRVQSETNSLIEDAKKQNDTEAEAFKALLCAVDLGAMYRNFTPAEQTCGQVFCDPAKKNASVTLQSVL